MESLWTPDIYLGAFLLCKGLNISEVRVMANDGKKKVLFRFDGNEAHDVSDEYTKGTLTVNAALAKFSIERMKDLLFQKMREHERLEDFQKVLKTIARYKEQKAKKTVTLNKQKFLAERAELNAERQQEKTLKELNGPDSATIKRDYYMDEALAITIDYLKMQQLANAPSKLPKGQARQRLSGVGG